MKTYARTYWFTWAFLVIAAALTGVASLKDAFFGGIFAAMLSALLTKVYDQYSFKLLPLMGRLVANDADSYRYLAESIRMHPDQATLKAMMKEAGFGHVDVHNLSAGIVALHVGIKC